MNGRAVGFVLLTIVSLFADAATPSPVTTVVAARDLPAAAFDGRRGFAFEGQVVSSGAGTCVLFDETGGACLDVPTNVTERMAAGDVCRVTGVLTLDADRDRHFVVRSSVRTGTRPVPPVRELSAAEIDAEANLYREVRVRGVVESVFRDELDLRYHWLVVRTASGLVSASLSKDVVVPGGLESLVDAEVEVAARVTPCSSLRRHLGAHLSLSDSGGLRVLVSAASDPFGAPPYRGTDELHRRRATGRVLAASATRFFLDAGEWDPCLQVRLSPGQTPPVPGRNVSVVGFTRRGPAAMRLVNSVCRDEVFGLCAGERARRCNTTSGCSSMNCTDENSGSTMAHFAEMRPRDTPPRTDRIRDEGASPAPEPAVTALGIDALFRDADDRNQMDVASHGKLVRVIGRVRCRGGAPATVGLATDRHEVWLDLSAVTGLPDLAEGTLAEVVGLLVAEPTADEPSGIRRFVGFTLIPRTAEDIRVLSRPPWWTAGRLLVALGIVGLLLIGFAVWNRSLRLLAERRGEELSAGNVARAEAEMRTLERTRLAVELHDSIAQNLTLASYELKSAEQLVPEGAEELANRLEIVGHTVKSCNCDLRNCLWDLRNEALDQGDMNEAIRRTLLPHVRGVSVVIRFNIPRERLTDTTAHALLRIIRELVINAVRHGRATEIKVAGSVDRGALVFSVRDNGCGFDPARRPGVREGHLGLEGVFGRARQLGGTVNVESAPGKGTRIVVSLALAAARAEAMEGTC